MTTTSSRPFIAAMQVTLDGHILGPDGEADWVDSWADGLELLPEVDAFVLGGGMFPDYERSGGDPGQPRRGLRVARKRPISSRAHLRARRRHDPASGALHHAQARHVADGADRCRHQRASRPARAGGQCRLRGWRAGVGHQPHQLRPARRASPDRAPSRGGKRDGTVPRDRPATGARASENGARGIGPCHPHLPAQIPDSGEGNRGIGAPRKETLRSWPPRIATASTNPTNRSSLSSGRTKDASAGPSGHADTAPPSRRRQVQDRARHARGLQPSGRRRLRDRRLKRRITNPSQAGTTSSSPIPGSKSRSVPTGSQHWR